MIRIYGDKTSGNCLKILYLANLLALQYEWTDIDIMRGDTQTDSFRALNPAAQVPVIELENHQTLAQSNAILLYLAHGSKLLPDSPWALAKVQEWLFWEQYSHEPNIAVCRAQKVYHGKTDAELDPVKVEKGNLALDLMDSYLQGSDWLVGDYLTIADIALVAYTRLAHEGGFSLTGRDSLQRWIGRTQTALGI